MSETSVARLAQAEQAARDARAQLGATLDEIQDKLSPANLISETGKGLREKSLEFTDNLFSTVGSRPVLATAAATAIGWLISRKPALAIVLRLFFGNRATSRRSAHSIDAKPQRNRAPRSRARPVDISKETP